MKRIALFSLVILSTILQSKADSLWIEADATGQMGKPQIIKVIFGSYNQYRLQKVGEEFQEVKDFTCWIISPTGKYISLQFFPKDTSFEASFTPEEKGIYVVLLENKQRKVEDWSKSTTKIGITKQHYYARTTIQVGNVSSIAPDALTDLTIVKDPSYKSGPDVTLQVLLHGKPVPNATLFMRHPEMQEQKLTTDQDGRVSFHAPRPGRYFSLVTLKFETPGTYRGVHYDVFREKSTLTMIL
ncbi:MAG: DUF4198 domain-containing protein [Chitinophagaceae bacterium]|nr:DUF4198 domain-containing protein [Chitinophagaceae bacterium]